MTKASAQSSDDKPPRSRAAGEASILKQQLMREIACLERQLERVRSREEFAEYTTIQTYEEMINDRYKMLENLPWTE